MTTNDNTMSRITKVVDEIKQRGIDITAKYDEWMLEGFALGSLGEEGREPFHAISSMHQDYDYDKCNAKFDNILATSRNTVSIGSPSQDRTAAWGGSSQQDAEGVRFPYRQLSPPLQRVDEAMRDLR